MLAFQSSESRARHRATDAYFDLVDAAVHDDAFKRFMPADQQAIAHVYDNMLYTPNISHGEAVVPKKHAHDESIPVLLLNDGEIIRTRSSSILSLHALQRQSLERYASGSLGNKGTERDTHSFAHSVANHVAAAKEHIDISLRPQLLGMVLRPGVMLSMKLPNIGKSSLRNVSSRPIMVLPMKEVASPRRGSVGIHEIQHVTQVLKTSVERVDQKSSDRLTMRYELEAYYLESMAGVALFNYSDNPAFLNNEDSLNPVALMIEKARLELNKDRQDAFEPTGTIRNTIIQLSGLDLMTNSLV